MKQSEPYKIWVDTNVFDNYLKTQNYVADSVEKASKEYIGMVNNEETIQKIKNEIQKKFQQFYEIGYFHVDEDGYTIYNIQELDFFIESPNNYTNVDMCNRKLYDTLNISVRRKK